MILRNSFLIKYLKLHKFRVFLVIIGLLITAATVLGFGYLLKSIFNSDFTQAAGRGKLISTLVKLSMLGTIFGIASFIRSYNVYIVGDMIMSSIRSDIYNSVIKAKIAEISRVKPEVVLSTFSNEVAQIGSLITNSLSFILRNMLIFCGSIILMSSISLKLTFWMFILVPVIVLPFLKFFKFIKVVSSQASSELARFNAVIQQIIYNISIVKLFNDKRAFNNIYQEALNNLSAIEKKRLKYRCLFFSVLIVLVIQFIAVLIYLGLNEVVVGNITSGDLGSFIYYAVLAGVSLSGLSDGIGDVIKSSTAIEKIKEVLKLDHESLRASVAKGIAFKPSRDSVYEIADVDFSYNNVPVLQNIIGEIKQGEFVAIKGKSGSGKTSVINLLLGFYTPTNGKIIFGSAANLEKLRAQTSYVPQDSIIFTCSLRENILMHHNINQEELENIIELANLTELVESLPEGLDTIIGDNGHGVSGGQKQRIAIARALAKDADIIIFDEPTSSLDSENEKLISQIFKRLKEMGKTVIVVSHKKSTIKEADKIFTIEDGKMVA